MNVVIEAARYAAKAHAGQQRKYERGDYIVHPMRVAGRVTLLDYSTEEMIAAAWLHDVVEDTDRTLDDMAQHFSIHIVGLVGELTSDKYPGLSRGERKEKERLRLADVSRQAKIIKCCDRLDNLQDLPPNAFRQMYARESVQLVDIMVYYDNALISHPVVMALFATATLMAKDAA